MKASSRDVLDRVDGERDKVKWPPGFGPDSDFKSSIQKNIDEAINRTFDLKHGNKGMTKEQAKHEVRQILSRGNYNELLAAANTYKQLIAVHNDQHEQLKKIENGQGLRNLIWRAATTFTIASIIFFFYWIASCLGIALPLSRLAL
ncbi:hypothetical protein [Marinobacter arenosus]|uniref:hypothetical protein n=1 Tax=Marinobacter arenosus TaxID=2856822 RepID=UPI001C4B8426|nr:hypothetical protein [Marinobacter arenosus]MBW0148806.1 hypothetical protein [Marinobacter arenosus]